MDSQTRKRSFFSYALDFLFLTPFVAFAAGEILALLLWKLAARTLQKFCSTVTHSLLGDSNRKDETVQNIATKTAVNHQPKTETNYHLQQNATLKIGCVTGPSWPLENTELPVSGEKSQVKRNYFKGEVTQSQKRKDEKQPCQKPRLFTAQWVTKNKDIKIRSNKTNEEEGPLNRNPKINCPSVFKSEKFLINSHDREHLRGQEDSKDSLLFERKFRTKGTSKRNFVTPMESVNYMNTSTDLPLYTVFDHSVQKNGTGCMPVNKSLPDWTGITEEKCYSGTCANPCTEVPFFATKTPAITSETPVTSSQVKENGPVTKTLNGKIRETEETFPYNHSFSSRSSGIAVKSFKRPADQGAELQSNNLADAQGQPAKITKRATTEAEETDVLEVAEISSATSEKPCYTEEEKTDIYSHRLRSHLRIGPSVRGDVTEKHNRLISSLEALQQIRQSPENSKFSVPRWGTSRTNHKRTRAANSSKSTRERSVKLTQHSRLPLGRASRRKDLRKERIPLL